MKVTDEEIKKYYEENKEASSGRRPPARCATSSSRTRAQRRRSFTTSSREARTSPTLAKRYSQDPSSKDQGGKFTAQKGATVAPFDRAAFALETGELSQPVRTRVRLPPDRGSCRRQEGQLEAARVGRGGDPPDAAQGEAERGDDRVGRGPEETSGRRRRRTRSASSRPPPPRARPSPSRRRPASPVGGGDGLERALVDLQELAERLRRECPWDRAQTAKTIVPHTVEEAYEVADAALAERRREAARRARRPPLPDRLPRAAPGGARRGRPGTGRSRDPREARAPPSARVLVARGARIARRGEGRAGRSLKADQEGREGIFHHVPARLPALLHARKVQRRAAAVGFEYADVDGALADLEDEVRRASRGAGGDARGRRGDRARPTRLRGGRRRALRRCERRAPAERRPRARPSGCERALRRSRRARVRARSPRRPRLGEAPARRSRIATSTGPRRR